MPVSELNDRINDLYVQLGTLKNQVEIVIQVQNENRDKENTQKLETADRLTRIEAKLDTKTEYLSDRIIENKQELNELKQNIKAEFAEMREKLDSTLKWVIGICLTSVFGVAAIVIAVLLK